MFELVAIIVAYVLHIVTHRHIAIFGAGHVAKALVPILAQLPVRISWIDSREELFPSSLPANVHKVVEEVPESEVRHLDENSWLIILTHDHQLDYRITEQALKQPSLPFVGLIGSDTKAKRFITKLTQRGFDDNALARLFTPSPTPYSFSHLPLDDRWRISRKIELLPRVSDAR